MRSLFVDVARNFNAIYSIDPNKRLNYKRYFERAVGEDKLYKAIAYGVQREDEAKVFMLVLRNIGFEPKYRPARIIRGNPSINQTSNNLNIALDVVRQLRTQFVDTIVLGSNDIELIPLIEWIKEQGIRVHLFSSLMPRWLRDAADSFEEITEDLLDVKEEESVTVADNGNG
jgi:uncharacterized LabA/DUF88 family protein